jgi:hypothetical protein
MTRQLQAAGKAAEMLGVLWAELLRVLWVEDKQNCTLAKCPPEQLYISAIERKISRPEQLTVYGKLVSYSSFVSPAFC